MARSSFRYRHFFAAGKTYKHFWQDTSAGGGPVDGNAAGATITVNASLLAGAAAADGNAAGVTLTVNASLIAGLTTVTATGQTLSRNVSLIAGEATGSANANGVTKTVTTNETNFGYGHVDVFPSGTTYLVDVTLDPGEATGNNADGNADGVTLTVNASLIPGEASTLSQADGDLLTVYMTGVAGAAFGQRNVLIDGQLLEVDVSLIDGVATVSPEGVVFEVDVSLIAGTATGELNGSANGVTLTATVSLIAGATTVTADPQTLTVNVSLIDGVATGGTAGDAFANGAILTVDVLLLEGVATGTTPTPPQTRTGGPIGYSTKRKPHVVNAQAFGAVFLRAAQVFEGKAAGEVGFVSPPAPLAPLLEPAPPPEERRQAVVAELLQIGHASADVLIPGVVLEVWDPTEYDNELVLELA